MARTGNQYGPDYTFLGVDACDLDEPASFAGADVVVLGAPFDGGTSARSGARFGPLAIRAQDYLPHDGSRPSLALRTDGLVDLRVIDAGDVEMHSGDIEVALPALEAAVEKVARAGAIPVVLGGDHSIAYPDAVVEVSPPFDHAGVTAAPGNRVVLESLSAFARRRRDEGDGTTWDPARPLLDGR